VPLGWQHPRQWYRPIIYQLAGRERYLPELKHHNTRELDQKQKPKREQTMIFLSSNAYSADDQTADVISYLSTAGPVRYTTHTNETAEQIIDRFTREFPEYGNLAWSGSWADTEASGVDEGYMDWVRDWIEANTAVTWWEGEPVIFEEGDEDDD
jgi:hypothetical protein